jgi:hypothetical protein
MTYSDDRYSLLGLYVMHTNPFLALAHIQTMQTTSAQASLVLVAKHHAMKAYRGSGDKDPCIVSLGTGLSLNLGLHFKARV